jgi:hypothetical protein
MLGVTGKHLEPIQELAKILDPDTNPEKLGAWGILFLCCGAFAGGNATWREIVINSESYVCLSDLPKLLQGENVCTSDDYASKFAENIKEFSSYNAAIKVAENRMEKYRGKISESAFLCNKTWLILAFMLNSLQDMTMEELLGFNCQTWVNVSSTKTQIYGWPELFFAAGLLLKADTKVKWHEMASAIHSMNKPYKENIAALFEHYAGRNPFGTSVKGKVRADQLKKGVLIRLKNGWEAIVDEECQGNTLKAKVFGDFTEIGSIYAHDIVATKLNGDWVEVVMTDDQARFYEEVKSIFDRSA